MHVIPLVFFTVACPEFVLSISWANMLLKRLNCFRWVLLLILHYYPSTVTSLQVSGWSSTYIRILLRTAYFYPLPPDCSAFNNHNVSSTGTYSIPNGEIKCTDPDGVNELKANTTCVLHCDDGFQGRRDAFASSLNRF